MSKVIGIDLGTTNSVAAVYEPGGGVRVIPTANGARTTPSVVGFTESGQPIVGHPAKNQQITNPQHTVYSVKRFMGRRHHEVENEEKIVPYRVVGKGKDFVRIQVRRRRYLPQEISAMILREIKRVAEAQLGEPVTRAVVTVPAYFNDSQRQATKDAGAIAGLEVERIINEPTAAALAYGLEKRDNRRIVVFDFGGGTFDLSVLEIGGGTFQVLAVYGNTHLGGDDFDQRIIDIVADDFRRKERIDVRHDPMALQRLKEAAQKAKCDLSACRETTIMLPFIAVDGAGPKHLQHTLRRETFESVCVDLFEELRASCRTLLQQARISAADISEVVMVGGSTRIPKVQEIACEVFDTDVLDKSINPDEVVALGAGILGGVLQGDLKNVLLMDVTSQNLGIETARGRVSMLIPRNTPIPVSVDKEFMARQGQKSVPIHIVEGDSEHVDECRTLGLVRLKGLKKKTERGMPEVAVEFAVDHNGILKVKATDKATGKVQEMEINGAVGLNRHDVERMRRESEAAAAGVNENQELVDLRNHAEGVVYDMQKWLEYNGHLLPNRDRVTIVQTLMRIEKKIKSNDRPGLKAALRKLDSVSAPVRKVG